MRAPGPQTPSPKFVLHFHMLNKMLLVIHRLCLHLDKIWVHFELKEDFSINLDLIWIHKCCREFGHVPGFRQVHKPNGTRALIKRIDGTFEMLNNKIEGIHPVLFLFTM